MRLAKEMATLTPEVRLDAEQTIATIEEGIRNMCEPEIAEDAIEACRETALLVCLYSGRPADEVAPALHAMFLNFVISEALSD